MHCGEFLGWEEEPPSLDAVDVPSVDASTGERNQPLSAAAAEAQRDAVEARQEALRVQTEASARARRATDDAVRKISEQTRQGRIDVLSKVQLDVDRAGQRGGDVDEVRRQAEERARSEIDIAEFQAARRARRAREDAYAQARKEAADAGQVAAEKANRAAALAASGPDDAQIRAPDATIRREKIEPVGAPLAPRRADKVPTGVSHPTIRAGQVSPLEPVTAGDPQEARGGADCWNCGTQSPTSRHFCRRCGSVMVRPLPTTGTSWKNRARDGKVATKRGAPALGPPPGTVPKVPASLRPRPQPAKRRTRTLSSLSSKSKGALVVVVAIAAVLGLGHQSQVASGLDSLRTRFAPKPVYLRPEVAFVGNTTRRIPALTDTREAHPLHARRTGGFATAGAPVFSVVPDDAGGVAEPVSLYAVGLVVGALNRNAAPGPSPHHIQVVAYDPSGRQRKIGTFTLKDVAGFQSFHFDVTDVSRVDVYVVDVYRGSVPTDRYVVDQIEFFRRS